MYGCGICCWGIWDACTLALPGVRAQTCCFCSCRFLAHVYRGQKSGEPFPHKLQSPFQSHKHRREVHKSLPKVAQLPAMAAGSAPAICYLKMDYGLLITLASYLGFPVLLFSMWCFHSFCLAGMRRGLRRDYMQLYRARVDVLTPPSCCPKVSVLFRASL